MRPTSRFRSVANKNRDFSRRMLLSLTQPPSMGENGVFPCEAFDVGVLNKGRSRASLVRPLRYSRHVGNAAHDLRLFAAFSWLPIDQSSLKSDC